MRTLLLVLLLSAPASAQGIVAYRLDPYSGAYIQTTPNYFYRPYAAYSGYGGGYGGYGAYDAGYELRRIRWELEDANFDRRWREWDRRWTPRGR